MLLTTYFQQCQTENDGHHIDRKSLFSGFISTVWRLCDLRLCTTFEKNTYRNTIVNQFKKEQEMERYLVVIDIHTFSRDICHKLKMHMYKIMMYMESEVLLLYIL